MRAVEFLTELTKPGEPPQVGSPEFKATAESMKKFINYAISEYSKTVALRNQKDPRVGQGISKDPMQLAKGIEDAVYANLKKMGAGFITDTDIERFKEYFLGSAGATGGEQPAGAAGANKDTSAAGGAAAGAATGGEQKQQTIPRGAEVEIGKSRSAGGGVAKYRWEGAIWAEVSPRTGGSGKFANKKVAQELTRLYFSKTKEPAIGSMTPDQIKAAAAAKSPEDLKAKTPQPITVGGETIKPSDPRYAEITKRLNSSIYRNPRNIISEAAVSFDSSTSLISVDPELIDKLANDAAETWYKNRKWSNDNPGKSLDSGAGSETGSSGGLSNRNIQLLKYVGLDPNSPNVVQTLANTLADPSKREAIAKSLARQGITPQKSNNP